ncbi:MAG: hypothetical protein KC589_04925, partial [Nanoarchaeota archaeon]|nr:hypothetical protein [Nanoarchaeota archaeon]
MTNIFSIFSKEKLTENEIKNNEGSPNFNGTILSIWDLNENKTNEILNFFSSKPTLYEKISKYKKTENFSPNFEPKISYAIVIFFKTNEILWEYFNSNIQYKKIKNKFYLRFDERDLQKLGY